MCKIMGFGAMCRFGFVKMFSSAIFETYFYHIWIGATDYEYFYVIHL